jgi:hypothetical protein
MLFLFSMTIFAQNWQFANQGGGTDADVSRAIATDSQGNSYITGYFTNVNATFAAANLTNAGGEDIFVAKYSPTGTLLWAQSFGGTGDERGLGISIDANNNCYLTGTVSNTVNFGGTNLVSAGNTDIFVAKLNANTGAVQWAVRGGGVGLDAGYQTVTDAGGNIYLAGNFQATATFGGTTLISAGSDEILIAKYDPNGNLVWARQAGGGSTDSGRGIGLDNQGNIYISGLFSAPNANFSSTILTPSGGVSNDIFLAKYDTNGLLLWVRQAGGVGNDTALRSMTDGNGNTYMTGYYSGTATFGSANLVSAGGFDIFIAKYDNAGSVTWAKRAGSTGNDIGYGIAANSLGNVYVSGSFQNMATFDAFNVNSLGGDDIFVARYDVNGNVQWVNRSGNTGNDIGWAVSMGMKEEANLTGTFQAVATFGANTLNSVGLGDAFIAQAFIAPTQQATNIVFGNLTSNSLGLNWTNGNGARRIVKMNTQNVFTNPVNGTDPVANASYTGAGEQVIFNGTGNLAFVSNLLPSTQYFFRVYEYNGTGINTLYQIAPDQGNPNSINTLAPIPTAQPRNLLFSEITSSGFRGRFSHASPRPSGGYLVLLRPSNQNRANPVNSTTYQVGSQTINGQLVLASGLDTTFTATGLRANTEYAVDVYAYNGTNQTIAYLTTNPLSGNVLTINEKPILTSITPAQRFVGTGEFMLIATGRNFVRSSVIQWQGIDLPTTFVSPTELRANVFGSFFARAGTYNVTIFTPNGGGVSDALPFRALPSVFIGQENTPAQLVSPNTDSHILYRLRIVAFGDSLSLQRINIPLSGTFQPSDIKNNGFSLYFSRDSVLSPNDVLVQQLANTNTSNLAFNRRINLPQDTTIYLFVTANIAREAFRNRTIQVREIPQQNLVFTREVNKVGNSPLPAGGVQTIRNLFLGNISDSLLLVTFYRNMKGEQWRINWQLSNPVGTWHGLELDERGRLIAIRLVDNNLQGDLSNVIFQSDNSLLTTELKIINFSGNKITGTIPIQITNAKKLQYLDLSNNQMAGLIIGEIGNLTFLNTLWLSFNQFAEVHPNICNLLNIKNLILNNNQLKRLPNTLGNMRTLEFLRVENNLLDEIPESIADLHELGQCFLQQNNLTSIPKRLITNKKLKKCTVFGNRLDFGSLAPFAEWVNDRNIEFAYTPQQRIGQPALQRVQRGEQISWEVITRGENNSYQWQKDNQSISNAIRPAFSVANAKEEDAGTYVLFITNHKFPNLTLISQSIVLQIDCSNAQNLRPSINMASLLIFCGVNEINTELQGNASNIVGVANLQWLRNSEVLVGETNSSLRVRQEGNYQLLVNTRSGCSYLSIPVNVLRFAPYFVVIRNNNNVVEASTDREISTYEWFVDGRIIENMSQSKITPIQSGNYTLITTDRNGCRSTSNALMISITSVAEDIYEGEVLVYPNPTTSVVMVESKAEKIKMVRVFGVIGKLLADQYISKLNSTYQIDLSKQASGIYFIEITTQKGRIIKRLVRE